MAIKAYIHEVLYMVYFYVQKISVFLENFIKSNKCYENLLIMDNKT